MMLTVSCASRHPDGGGEIASKITTEFPLQGPQPVLPPAQFFVMGADSKYQHVRIPNIPAEYLLSPPFLIKKKPSQPPCLPPHAWIRAAGLQALSTTYFVVLTSVDDV
jgi:hypothetical protein